MTEHIVYNVGGHTFTIDFPQGILSEKELMHYAPFQTYSYFEKENLFSLTLFKETDIMGPGSQPIATLQDENGKMTIFSHEDGSLMFYLTSVSGTECCRLYISKDYRVAKAWIGGTVAERRYALDTALMLLYTFASAKHDTLLIHASVVEHNGKGYLFLGKSGTGKSTHSRLWLENVKGSELLNDDNPIIRIIDDKVYVYGSPWSGKTTCYRNRKVPVGGIVRLHQALVNKIIPLTGIKAYAAVLPACSCMKWDREMAAYIHTSISKVIESISVYSLECLPNREAALLCSENVLT